MEGAGNVREFASPGDFARFLSRLAGTLPQAEALATRDAAALIQEEAQAILGHEQGPVGPFPAWEPLSERTQCERYERGLTPDDPLLATGELKHHIDMTYEGRHAVIGVPAETVGEGTHVNPSRNIGEVAVVMEFGNERVPPRSFLGRAAVVAGEDAAHVAGLIVSETIAGLPQQHRSASAMRGAAGLKSIPF